MNIIHIPLTVRESAAWNAQIIQITGRITLPSYARVYLISANCKISVRDTTGSGNPYMYMGSDSYGALWNSGGMLAETFAKFQGYDADVALRNYDGTKPVVLNEAVYTPILGHLDGINYNIFLNPQGEYAPREPILLNLNPDYEIGLWANIRYASAAAVVHNFGASDVYAYVSLILEFGLEMD